MNTILQDPRVGKLTEAELNAAIARSPAPRMPRIPHGCDQQGRYPMPYLVAAEAATELGADDDDAKSIADIVMDWLTPSRFWALYVLTFVGAMLAVWVVLT